MNRHRIEAQEISKSCDQAIGAGVLGWRRRSGGNQWNGGENKLMEIESVFEVLTSQSMNQPNCFWIHSHCCQPAEMDC